MLFMQRNVAYLLLIVTLGLIALGLVMLSSTGAVLAHAEKAGVYGDLQKQLTWLGLGTVVCAFFYLYDYQKLLRFGPMALGIACVLLILCLVIGHVSHGSPRWLRYGKSGLGFQPSEFTKLAMILFLAWWMGKNQRHVREFVRGSFGPMLCVAPVLTLMVLQQDLGTASIMLAIAVTLLFCAGTKILHLLPYPVAGLTAIITTSIFIPERLARWTAFLSTTHLGEGKGMQQQEGLIALGSGGLYGLGLGNSLQKMYWLPEMNTDFIFPIIGEELGLWVTLSIVLAFLLLLFCSGWITIHAPDPAGVLLGTGITVMLALQALMNLAVVTEMMPCKGIPLPFISYGGSNLLTCLAAIGILFNLHRQGIYQTQGAPAMASMSYSVRM